MKMMLNAINLKNLTSQAYFLPDPVGASYQLLVLFDKIGC
jgi:hypothetical protein